VTNWDFLLRDGVIHLEEGASLVTVVTASPLDGALIAAYADGSTRKWYLDEAAFEPPRLGPRAPSAIRRFEWDAAGTLALITCDTGLVVAPVAPPRPPLFVPGEMAVAYLDSNRDRFAAIRGGRIHVRYLPMDLLKSPMPNRVVGGFITVTPKEETLPLGVMANGFLPPGGVPTFIAWNQGRVITGTADGTITALPAGGGGTAFTSREHKRPVKAWTVSPTGDFAFGDEDGFVGYWPRGGKAIARFKSGAVAVQGLSFSPCGGEVAVVDILGWVSIWDPVKGSKLVEMKQKQPAAAVAYARDDLLMVAAGKGVDVYWLPAMLEP
jgi:WD40 repeat protein